MNPAILTTYPSRNYDPQNGAYYTLLQQLLLAAGESADKYSYLAPRLCGSDRRLKVTEKRKAEWVRFLVAAYTAGVDPATLPDLKGCDTLVYKNLALLSDAANAGLLRYSTTIAALVDDKASVVIDPTGANNSVTWTATQPGLQGNLKSITYLDPGGVTATLEVNVNGNDIVVRLGRAASAINTTATALQAAVAANAAAAAIMVGANTGADTGAGLVTAMPKTFLAGGLDSLDMLVTANNAIAVGTIQEFVLAGILEAYRLDAATTAESSPTTIRANDYHAVNNPRVWTRVTAGI
jgi:hypothetical protein